MSLRFSLFALLLFSGGLISGLLVPSRAWSYTEKTLTFSHQGKTLEATLCLPEGNGPFPVIILHPGSGAMDKDGTLLLSGGNAPCLYPDLNGKVLRPYQDLRRAMAAAGFAMVTYDKMEFSYPLPPLDFVSLFLPSESLLHSIAQHPQIDPNQIILMGHSEGSSLIPYIKKRNPLYSIRALISIAGPRSPLDSMVADQLLRFARLCGQDTTQAITQENQVIQYGLAIRQSSWDSTTPPLFGLPASSWADYFQVVDSVAYHYRDVPVPVLFVGLEDDLNVPVNEEAERLRQEVPQADHYRLPGLNHFMTTATEPRVSSLLTDTLVNWLHRQHLSVRDQAFYEQESFEFQFRGREAKIRAKEGHITQVCLIDARGAQIFQSTVYEKSLRYTLADLPAGTYVFLVSGKNHQQSFRFAILH